MGRQRRRAILTAVLGAMCAWADAAAAADRTFNVSLVGSLNPLNTTNNIYADLWAEGNLVVLGSVSSGSGVTIINNANPAAPTMVSRYSPSGNANGQFRDVLIRNGIGYFAIDSSTTGGLTTLGGIHIVNLANPASPVKIAEINAGASSGIKVGNGFLNNHDLFLDGNYLYIADNRNAVMKVFNVANPAAPTFVRDITTAGAITDNLHDMTIKNGRMFTSNLDNGITQIYDVSNMSTTVAPTLLGQFSLGTRNHSTWPSEDGKLLAVAREDTNGEVQLWNIQNPAAPSVISSITAAGYGIDSHSAHNPVIIGDTLYVSWYQAGLQIFDIRNPATPIHLGAYDTFVGGDGNAGSFSGYDGNWGLYPWFGKDKILLSDFDNGFFTVNATDAFRQVWTYNGGPVAWQDNSRWDNGAPFPNSSEMVASFTNPAAGATRTVFVEGTFSPSVPRVGGMEFSSSLAYTIQPSNGGEIEMIASDGPAKITVLGSAGPTVSNRIVAPIQLNDDLLITNNASSLTPMALEINTLRGANRTLTIMGAGETAYVAANPDFTGNVVINGGRLGLRHAQGINAMPISAIGSGGVLVLRNNVSTNFQSDLSVSGSMFLSVGNGGAGNGQTHALDDISIAAGGAMTLVRNNGAHLLANHMSIAGTVTVTPEAGFVATRFDTLEMLPGGKVNLSDAPLIVASTPLATVEGYVRGAYHFGAWDGEGITTNQPDALAGLTTLAVATADQVGRSEFGGIGVGGDDVLVMYTYAGDANLDGIIDGGDYGIIDNYVQVPGAAGYGNGDFNFDGVIDGGDYGIIDNNIQAQGTPFSSSSSLQITSATAVPEATAACGIVGLCMAHLMRRRRALRIKMC